MLLGRFRPRALLGWLGDWKVAQGPRRRAWGGFVVGWVPGDPCPLISRSRTEWGLREGGRATAVVAMVATVVVAVSRLTTRVWCLGTGEAGRWAGYPSSHVRHSLSCQWCGQRRAEVFASKDTRGERTAVCRHQEGAGAPSDRATKQEERLCYQAFQKDDVNKDRHRGGVPVLSGMVCLPPASTEAGDDGHTTVSFSHDQSLGLEIDDVTLEVVVRMGSVH